MIKKTLFVLLFTTMLWWFQIFGLLLLVLSVVGLFLLWRKTKVLSKPEWIFVLGACSFAFFHLVLQVRNVVANLPLLPDYYWYLFLTPALYRVARGGGLSLFALVLVSALNVVVLAGIALSLSFETYYVQFILKTTTVEWVMPLAKDFFPFVWQQGIMLPLTLHQKFSLAHIVGVFGLVCGVGFLVSFVPKYTHKYLALWGCLGFIAAAYVLWWARAEAQMIGFVVGTVCIGFAGFFLHMPYDVCVQKFVRIFSKKIFYVGLVLVFVVLACICIFVFTQLQFLAQMLRGYQGNNPEVDVLLSNYSRITLFFVAFGLWFDSFVFGNGLFSFMWLFPSALLDLRGQEGLMAVIALNPALDGLGHPHNDYILSGVEGGVVGFCLLFFWYLSPVFAGFLYWRRRKQLVNAWGMLLLLAITTFTMSSVLFEGLFGRSAALGVFGFAVAICVAEILGHNDFSDKRV